MSSAGDADLHLGQYAHCRPLSGPARGKLCEQLTQRPARRVASGQFLYLIGEPATSLYFLRRGLVKTGRTSPAGDEMILHLHQPGEIFGELCFCTGERTEHAMALEASEVTEILLEDLLANLRRNPEATLDLVTALSERLGDTYARLQSLSFESTQERLVRTLLVLADTLGEVTPEGVHIAHYVKQEELAQMVAARREVVSSLLNRLRERGLIGYPRKGQISLQRQALQTYLDSLGRETDE
jgi:CRP-like cAMP-binding protein